MFVFGCDKLTISTDHKPLLGILRDCDLAGIANTRISRLKQCTFPFRFGIQYNPGKWHRGPDAVSRNPVPDHGVHHLYITEDRDFNDEQYEEEMMTHLHAMLDMIAYPPLIASINDNCVLITLQEFESAAADDSEYAQLMHATTHRFPMSRS